MREISDKKEYDGLRNNVLKQAEKVMANRSVVKEEEKWTATEVNICRRLQIHKAFFLPNLSDMSRASTRPNICESWFGLTRKTNI